MIYKIIEIIEIIVPILLGTAFLTLGERKWLGAAQRRVGPELIGREYGGGILQAFGDALKLIIKENIKPKKAIEKIYKLGPIISISLSIIMWIIIPIKDNIILKEENLGILLILSISSLGVYGIIYSGWSSNSRYGWLGTLRSTAQVISYEISIGIIIMIVIISNKSLNLLEIIYNQIYIINLFQLLPISIFFFISALAETNRAPFDIQEAESELVAGTLVEYSSINFVLLYLAEYINILSMSTITSVFFLGGSVSTIKTIIICILFIWVRASLPRLKFMDLISLGFTKILPLSISYILLSITIFSLNQL